MASGVPDLLVLDLHLPDLSGAEVLRGMRANPRAAETPVIVITAHPQMAAEVEGEVDLVLFKPLACDVLKRRATALVSGG